jgi:hypothetical protein
MTVGPGLRIGFNTPVTSVPSPESQGLKARVGLIWSSPTCPMMGTIPAAQPLVQGPFPAARLVAT